MATIYRVFNAKNQLVNSERIHRLFRHFSNYYSGVIGYQYNGVEYLSDSHMDDIISYNNTSKKITIQGDYIQFLIRGMLFMMSHPIVKEAYPRTGQTELSRNWLAENSSSGTVITPGTNYVYKLMSSSSSYPTGSWFYWDGDKYVKKDNFDNESVKFFGEVSFPLTNNNETYNLLGLIVDVDSIENSDINTITHHRLHTSDSIEYINKGSNVTSFGFYRIAGFEVKQNNTGLYTITKKNGYNYTNDWSNGYKFNAIKFDNLKIYGGLSRPGYMIPVAAITESGEYVRLLECHSKSSLEDFLTQTAINKLKSDLDSKYVWQGNCTDSTQSKGKIGDLIISKNHISGAGNTNNLIVDTEHLNFNGLKNNKSNIYNQNKKNGKYYNKNWDDDSGLPLTLQKDGYVWPVDYLRVKFGGTGADNKADARKNLGISSGKTLPGDSNPNYENGDIFLKIIE